MHLINGDYRKRVALQIPLGIRYMKWNSQCIPEVALPLTHWGLVTPYGDRDLGHHWLRKWLVSWRHQGITWTNVDLSSGRSSNIHRRESSHEIPPPSITEIILKIKYLKYHSNFPWVNYFQWCMALLTIAVKVQHTPTIRRQVIALTNSAGWLIYPYEHTRN